MTLTSASAPTRCRFVDGAQRQGWDVEQTRCRASASALPLQCRTPTWTPPACFCARKALKLDMSPSTIEAAHCAAFNTGNVQRSLNLASQN